MMTLEKIKSAPPSKIEERAKDSNITILSERLSEEDFPRLPFLVFRYIF
jgi:hypothetical protein